LAFVIVKDPAQKNKRDHVDIIIALGMAKEGFDWMFNHAQAFHSRRRRVRNQAISDLAHKPEEGARARYGGVNHRERAITQRRTEPLSRLPIRRGVAIRAIFRWSLVRMALQQRGARGQKLVRTDAFEQMDPTEKGAINYFLGLLGCKLFASKLLDWPWTLHLLCSGPA
jgi:hypothetical protein